MDVRSRALGAISFLVGIVAGFAILEVSSIAWLTVRDGGYTPAAELFDRMANTYIRETTRSSGCRYADTLFPHPYLGFVHHGQPPCGPANVNNVGLFGDDFPLIRRDDRYVVLLTGGSVASQLGQYAPPPAPRYLEEELNRHYISPTGKPFQVLNGGAGAWKQPQQLILFELHVDVVDAIVTLDGYNEQFMMQPGGRVRFELPANNFLDANPIVARDGFGEIVKGWLVGRVVGWLGQGMSRRSHAAYLVADALSVVSSRPASSEAHTFWNAMMLPPEISSSPDTMFALQVGQYRKYIRIMDMVARGYGVKSMFFLQPVPAIGKELTDEEKRATPDVAYGERYVQIVRELETLNEANIAVRNLLDVFAGEKGTIYADSIHPAQSAGLESRGYRLIAARMAQEMAAAWGLKTRPQSQQ